MSELMSLPVASNTLAIPYLSLWRRCTSGRVRSIRLDGKWYLPEEEVVRLLEERAAQHQPAAVAAR